MTLDWMGRYRELVRELIYHSNCIALHSNYNLKALDDGTVISKQEYQLLEYLVEFSDRNQIQANIAHDLGMQPSHVSIAIKHLLSLGLVERYRISGNKKSLIPKATPKGQEVYQKICERDAKPLFASFFADLETVSDEDLFTIVKAFRMYNKHGEDFANAYIKLEKVDE